MKNETGTYPNSQDDNQLKAINSQKTGDTPIPITLEVLKGLPTQLLQAMIWMLINYDALEAMCKNCERTMEELDIEIQEALAKENYFFLATLLLAKNLKENNEQ